MRAGRGASQAAAAAAVVAVAMFAQRPLGPVSFLFCLGQLLAFFYCVLPLSYS